MEPKDKREIRGWMIPAFLVLLSFSMLVSCDILNPTPAPPPSVESLTITRAINPDTKEPTDPTTTFQTHDPKIFAVAKVSNLVNNSQLTAKWYFNSVEVPEVRGTIVISGSGGSGYFSFSIVPSAEGFYIGNWKVEIYLDDVLVKSATFKVTE
jgi:hypothetical protein